MNRRYGRAALAALTFLLAAAHCALAASPGRVSYQGTLRKDGRLFSGTASMEFRLINADASVEYWNSGSTEVVVSTGLFRYPLGTPNDGQFAALNWKDLSPFVQMRVDGLWLPPEPLFSSVYSLHAVTAESSTGTFTVNGGDLHLTGAPGSDGLIFPDGTAQYYAPGWAVSPTLAYTAFAGSAGLGILSPETRLDVQAADATYSQFWRNSAGTVVASMTASGVLYADAAGIRNIPPGADHLGNHVATTTLQMAGFPIANAGAITANGALTTYSSATVGGALGLGAGRLQLRPGVEISSTGPSSYGGVYISSNVFLPAGARYYGDGSALSGVTSNVVDTLAATLGAGSNAGTAGMVNLGNVAIGLGAAGTRLDVQAGAGNYAQFWRNSGGTLVASMSVTGVLYADAAGLRGLPASDNLGNHTAGQNVRLGTYYLSGDGDGEGVSVNAAGGVGIGVYPATARFEVNDADADTATSGVKFTDFACGGFDKLTVDVSGNLVCSADQTGSGTGNLIDTLSETLGAGSNAGGAGMANLGNVAIGLGLAETRLDVQANAGGYSQFWRDSGGTVVASMSATGVLYADAAGIRGLPASDNMGDHVMTQNLAAGNNWISGDGGPSGLSVNSAGQVGIGVNPPGARLEVNDSDADVNTSGIKFTNFACSGTQKLTADLSGNLVCSADQTGSGSGNIIDSLSETLSVGNNAGAVGMVNLGNVAIGLGAAGTRLDVQAGAGSYTQFWRSSGGTVVASMSATGVLYADAGGLRGLPTADNFGNHTASENLRLGTYYLSGDGGSEGVSVNSNGDVGVGVYPATARLEVNDGDANTVTSGMKFTNFACTGTQKLTVDVSGNILCSADQTGSGTGNIIDDLSETLGAGNNAGAVGMVNLGDLALGLGTAGTRLDVQAGAGNYAQFWRNSGGTIVASMSVTGVLYGDAAGLRGLPTADNLGSHALEQNLSVGPYWLSGDGGNAGVSISAAGDVGIGVNPPTARLEVDDSDADVNTSGIKFTNFACSGTEKLTADLSGNLVCSSDQTGSGTGNIIDSLSETLGAGNNAGAAGMVNLGNVAIGLGLAETRLDVQTGAGGYSQFWRDAGGTVVASMSATGVLYASAAGMRGLPAADNLGNHTASQQLRLGSFYLSGDGDAEGVSVNSGGGVGVGVNPATARFEVNDGDANTGTSGMKFSNFACTGFEKLTVDVSGNLLCSADQTGSGTGNLIDNLSDTLSAGSNAGAAGMVNLGDVAIGLGAAAARLDVQAGAGSYAQIWRNSGGAIVASMSVTGELYADAAGIRGLPASDNLGNHTASQNLRLGNYYLSSDGNNEGVSVNASGGVGIGVNPATARLEVNDSDADVNTSGMRFTNFTCTGTQKLTVDVSGNLVCSADQLGSGTGNLIDSLSETLGAGTNAGALGMVNLGDVAVRRASAGTSLDVQAGVGSYSQFWRNSGGTIVASMSATGVLYGDASGLRNLPPSGADSLGTHIMEHNLTVGSYWLSNDGGNSGISLNATGGVGIGVNPATARLEINDSDASTLTSGMKFTNFACSGFEKLTVDVSGNLLCSADQTGSGTGNLVDTLSETLGAGNNAGTAGIVNLGDVAIGLGTAGTRLDVQAGAGNYSQFWRNSGGTIVASMSVTGELYADASQLRNLPAGNVVDTLAATLAAGRDAGNNYIANLSSAAIGHSAGEAVLDAKAPFGDPVVQIWRDAFGVVQASMTSAGELYADASQLRNLPSSNVIDTLADTLAAGHDAGGTYVNNLSSAAFGHADAEAALDARGVTGDTYVQIWRNSGGVIQASMTAAGVLYAESSGLRGGGGGNVVDTLAATLAAGPDAGGRYIRNLSSAAIGLAAGEAALDVQASLGDAAAQIWRDEIGVIQASMTTAGILYADGSQLRSFPHTATQDFNLSDFKLINASTITAAPGEPGIAFSTTLYVGGSVLAAGGGLFRQGPLLVGTELPLAVLHVSSGPGYAGNMVVVSTGFANLITMNSGGEIHANKFFGDGSELTGISAALGTVTSPATADFDLGNFGITNVNTVSVSSRIAAGSMAGPSPQVVSMIMHQVENQDIATDFPNEGVGVFVIVDPTSNKTGAEMVIGGDFIAGTTFSGSDFPKVLGVRATALKQGAGNLNSAYGVFVQNNQSDGVIRNNYGVYVDTPVFTGGTMQTNTGLYIADQSVSGAGTSRNILSKGANSINEFEGTVLAGKLRLPSKTLAQLQALVPVVEGEAYYCSNCSPKKIVVSTGTAAGNFADAAGGTFK
ncbi:MAG: hypothetical protein PHV33_04890 [Elusimicrobiales bacterium]|nr:hypothetical protein [Elusimicrobiales bacterium]